MSFIKAVATQGGQLLEAANKWHQTVVLWTIVGVVSAITAGVLANVAGFPKLNFLLAAITLLAGTFFLTKPAIALSVFGLGALTNGLPDIKLGEILRNGVGSLPNFELKKILGAGWDVVKATSHKVAHVFFLTTVFFVVLGTFPISDPVLVLPAIVILTGVGLWAALFTEGHLWYKRITFGLLVVSGIAVFYQMYDPQGKIERIEEAQAANQERLIDAALDPILRKAEHGIKLTPEEKLTLDAAKKREENRSVTKRTSDAVSRVIGISETKTVVLDWSKPTSIKIPAGRRTFRVHYPFHIDLNLKEGGVQQMVLNRGDVTGIQVSAGAAFDGDELESEGRVDIRLHMPSHTERYIRENAESVEPIMVRVTFE